jgi:hypothetical protein
MKYGMRGLLAVSVLVVAAAPAFAETAATPVGTDTRAWLQLQASGDAADGSERPMPGEVADRVYQRYLKSFEQPIPTEFKREQISSGGGSQ